MENKKDHNKVFSFAKIWVKKQFKVFDANDFKRAYLDAGNEMPINVNVFGGVFSSLAKSGLIFHHGAINSKTKESKGCLIRTWISLEFKQRQKENATNKNNLKLEL